MQPLFCHELLSVPPGFFSQYWESSKALENMRAYKHRRLWSICFLWPEMAKASWGPLRMRCGLIRYTFRSLHPLLGFDEILTISLAQEDTNTDAASFSPKQHFSYNLLGNPVRHREDMWKASLWITTEKAISKTVCPCGSETLQSERGPPPCSFNLSQNQRP